MTDEQLLRFLTKQCSDNDIREIDEWLALSPENSKWLFEIEKVWALKHTLKYSEEKELNKAFNELLSQIKTSEKRITLSQRKPFSILKYVAAAIIMLLLSVNIYQYIEPDPVGENELYIPTGQNASLTLSDGTIVWLNAESKLIYPSSFSTKERKVTLIGEGYFEVAKNDKSPFIVHTDKLETTVLGTIFNIKAYKEEESVITLVEGKVSVETINNKNPKQLILTPNQQVILSYSGELKLKNTSNADDITRWITGEQVFVDETLKNISTALERKYGVVIRIENPQLESELFSSHIQKDATIDEVLLLLKATRKLDYKFDGSKIILFN